MFYFYILVSISYILLVTAFVITLRSKKLRSFSSGMWYIIYLGYMFFIEIMLNISIYILERTTTLFLYPFYIAGEFFILMNLILSEQKANKKLKIGVGIVTVALFLATSVPWLENQHSINHYIKAVSNLVIISSIANLLLKNFKNIESRNPFSIIHAALFFYYSISLFLFLLMDQLNDININLWMINNILSSILYGSFIYTFYKLRE